MGTKNLNEALGAAESATNCKSGFSLTSDGATYCSQPCVQQGDCPTFDNAGTATQMTCSFDSSTKCGAAGIGDATGTADSFLYCRRP